MQSLMEESIMHQDESMISLDADDPPWVTLGRGAIITPPRTRRGPRVASRSIDPLVVTLPSRVVPAGITLTGQASRIIQQFEPSTLEMPQSIPIGEEVVVWDRRWIVRPSTLGPLGGLGLFACADIIFDETLEDSRPVLFPFCGHVYRRADWQVLERAHRSGFGLVSDGVSPFGLKTTSHSTWPVALINYNIPPWLATKKGFVILALIIPGPKQAHNFHVYLEPLIEELLLLNDGIKDVYDGRTTRIGRDRWFTLKGICMWTMHDYPGYGHVSGLTTKGYCACPMCGTHLPFSWSYKLHKVVYMEYNKFLPVDHPLKEVDDFGKKEEPPPATDFVYWEKMWTSVQSGHYPRDQSGIKRWSIFYRLPYWKSLLIRHLLDPMHIKANVMKALVKLLFGLNDDVRSRRACEEFEMHPDAWIQILPSGVEVMPPAPWVLPMEERKELIKRIKAIRFPTGFASCLRDTFKDPAKWPGGLKSHDLHVMMQLVFPACLHGLATAEVRGAIYDLSTLMRWVCSKEIIVDDIPRMDRASDEPFIYPSLVEQCFYVQCSDDPQWSIAFVHIPRERQFVQDRLVHVGNDSVLHDEEFAHQDDDAGSQQEDIMY
ncbi:hypothetical protein R1sor_009125 [Riccia sorocarpa]|uniref:Transposase n=1 Tax=Riccia sorocarpa TaxID=122646 RepID=A0ABD3H6V2_9MARC